MREKYIKLLLEKCINFDNSKSLFISYDIINQDFIDSVVEYAKKIGVTDIYLDKHNLSEEHDLLNQISLEEIEKHPYFNDSIWDEYAKKGASFLMLRAPFPGLMDDVDPKKLAKAEFIRRSTKPVYKKRQLTYEIPWCIAALPNKVWADKLFEGKENSLELLENMIYKICMVDTNSPIDSWNNYLNNNKSRIEMLNHLKLKCLNYKNSLGTNLNIELLENSIWCDAGSNGLVNMPSYEIFTSPNYKKTSGIVYSSRPLYYSGGLIDKFWIKFKDGKAIDCGAKVGEEILKGIINSDSNSAYLGEVALVENDSPISNTGLVYGLTLIDENASCHLALGAGFVECIENGEQLTEEELLNQGINMSKIHVDFMIGTPDLEITGETFDNKKVKIFEKGNFKK